MSSRTSVDAEFRRFQSSGDPKALAKVFDATAQELLRVGVYLTGDLDSAQDLLQSTFLTAIQRRGGYEPLADGSGVISWLLGIQVKKAQELQRARARQPDPERLVQRQAEDPSQVVLAEEFSKELSTALGKLPATYRQVLSLHVHHGLTIGEIARSLERSKETVRKQIARGLKLLRRLLPSSLVAGATVLSTPKGGAAAVAGVRQAVLSQAALVSGKSTTTSSLFGLSKISGLLAGTAGALTAVALTMALFVPGDFQETLPFHEIPASSHLRNLADSALEGSFAASHLSQELRGHATLHSLFLPPKVASSPNLQSRSLLTMQSSFTNAKLSIPQTWIVPAMLLGVATLFPALSSAQSLIYQLDGENAGDQFGETVTGAGDVNQDGYADIVVGAQWWDDPNGGSDHSHGRAYVFSGQDGSLLFTFEGENHVNRLGKAVSGAGDVNQDGYADVVVGADGWDDPNDPNGGDAGRVYVLSGQDGTMLWTFDGENGGDNFGMSLSGAGDVNQDGYDDVVVGARLWDDPNDPNAGTWHGRAYVFSGQNGSLLFTFEGENGGDRFGMSVSDAGDVNQDGYDDIVAGAHWWDDPNGLGGNSREGRVYVYSGQNGNLLFTFEGENAGDQLGESVSGAGDVNQDAYADIVVGAGRWDDPNGPGGDSKEGRVYVFSGQDGSLLFTMEGENPVDLFGRAVSGAGDVNQDGYDDVVTRSDYWDDPNNPNPGDTQEGRVYVFSGQDGSLLFTMEGENAGDRLGGGFNENRAIHGAGDVNQDGYDDIVVGARRWDDPNDPNGGTDHGRIYVISGAKLSLEADEHLISVTTGGVSNLNLCVPAHPNEQYLLLGSLNLGSTVIGSGVPTSGATMPINNDIWTSITWIFRNGPVFVNTQGSLDASGLATASINWPAALVVLGGNVTTYYAALIYGANDCGAGCDLYYATTNSVPVTFMP